MLFPREYLSPHPGPRKKGWPFCGFVGPDQSSSWWESSPRWIIPLNFRCLCHSLAISDSALGKHPTNTLTYVVLHPACRKREKEPRSKPHKHVNLVQKPFVYSLKWKLVTIKWLKMLSLQDKVNLVSTD